MYISHVFECSHVVRVKNWYTSRKVPYIGSMMIGGAHIALGSAWKEPGSSSLLGAHYPRKLQGSTERQRHKKAIN